MIWFICSFSWCWSEVRKWSCEARSEVGALFTYPPRVPHAPIIPHHDFHITKQLLGSHASSFSGEIQAIVTSPIPLCKCLEQELSSQQRINPTKVARCGVYLHSNPSLPMCNSSYHVPHFLLHISPDIATQSQAIDTYPLQAHPQSSALQQGLSPLPTSDQQSAPRPEDHA